MVKRVNISMDEEVLKMIDDFTEKTHMSRSTLIQISCRQYIDAQEKIPNLLKSLGDLKALAPTSWQPGIDNITEKVIEVQVK